MSASEAGGSPTNALIQRVYRHQTLPVLFRDAGQPLDKATPRRAVQSPQSYIVARRGVLPAHSEGREAVDAPEFEAPAPDAPAYPSTPAKAASSPPASATREMASLRWVRRTLSRLTQPTASRTPRAEAGAVVAVDALTQPDSVSPAPVQPAQMHTAAQFDVRADAPPTVHAPPVSSSPPTAVERAAQPEPAYAQAQVQPPMTRQSGNPASQQHSGQAQLASPTTAGNQEAPRVFSTATGSAASLGHDSAMTESRMEQPAGVEPMGQLSPAPLHRVVQAELAPPDGMAFPAGGEAPLAFPPVAGLTSRSWAQQPMEAPAAAQPRPQPTPPAPPAAAASPAAREGTGMQADAAEQDRTWARLKAILRAHEGGAQADAPSAPLAATPAAPSIQRTAESGELQPASSHDNPAVRAVETLDASGAAVPSASLEAKADPSPPPTALRSDELAQQQPGIAQPAAVRGDSRAVPVAPETAQVEKMLRSLPPARATESAIQVIAPRTPRPVQRQPAPRAGNEPNGTDSLAAPEPETAAIQMGEASPLAPSQLTIRNSQSTIHNSPLAPRSSLTPEPGAEVAQRVDVLPLAPHPSPLSEAGAGVIQMVDTEIGEMPVDLWALIGAAPPLSTGDGPRHGQGAARVAPGSSGAGAESVSVRAEPPAAAQMADAAAPARVAPLLATAPHPAVRRALENERTVRQGAPAVVSGEARPGVALQRQPVDVATAVIGAVNGEIGAPGDAADLPERAPGPTPAPAAAMAEPDVHELARQVYAHLRRRLAVEWERLG